MLPRRKIDDHLVREIEAELPADSERASGMRRIEIVDLGDEPIEIADAPPTGRDTDVSEAHGALGRLLEPTARPVLVNGHAAYLELSRDEAHTLALAATGARMDIILALSSMPEAETIQFLARLVLSGVLRVE